MSRPEEYADMRAWMLLYKTLRTTMSSGKAHAATDALLERFDVCMTYPYGGTPHGPGSRVMLTERLDDEETT